MSKTLENLYAYLLTRKGEPLTEIDCLVVEGVTTDNVIGLLELLENDDKISLDHTYVHYDITVN